MCLRMKNLWTILIELVSRKKVLVNSQIGKMKNSSWTVLRKVVIALERGLLLTKWKMMTPVEIVLNKCVLIISLMKKLCFFFHFYFG